MFYSREKCIVLPRKWKRILKALPVKISLTTPCICHNTIRHFLVISCIVCCVWWCTTYTVLLNHRMNENPWLNQCCTVLFLLDWFDADTTTTKYPCLFFFFTWVTYCGLLSRLIICVTPKFLLWDRCLLFDMELLQWILNSFNNWCDTMCEANS